MGVLKSICLECGEQYVMTASTQEKQMSYAKCWENQGDDIRVYKVVRTFVKGVMVNIFNFCIFI